MKARPTSPRAPKRRRDKEASKQALLAAAVETFATRGYDAATTREVAQKAGVAEGLIHRYYQSKAGLLLAVLSDYEDEQMRCALEVPAPSGSLEEEIRTQFSMHLDELKKKGDFARVVISRCIVDPAVAKQMRKHIFEEKIPVFVERFRQFQRDGKIEADADIVALAFTVSSMAFSLNFLGHLVFGQPEERMRATATLMARALARGLKPTG